jgi:hypothetical protein
MSTILDALKKVEGERPQSPREQLLHVPSPGTTRRRPISITTIVACAALGFAAGIGFALWRNAPPLDIDELAGPSPPPSDVVTASRPAGLQDAVGAPAAGAAPKPAAAAPPDRGIADGPGDQAAVDQHPELGTRPAPPPRAPAAGVGLADSVLEPSPFTLPRPGSPAPGAEAHVARAPSAPPVVPAPPPPADVAPAPDAMAALAPTVPQGPIATEPEPPPAPPTVIDTGRSPPGAPRVALSFLQWSPDPTRRFALISIDGAPSQRVREGDTAAGLTVAQITPGGVQFKHEANLFTIRPRH